MADDRIALLELPEKHADGNFSSEPSHFVLQRLMKPEARQRCRATQSGGKSTTAAAGQLSHMASDSAAWALCSKGSTPECCINLL